jgi:hypothetical protein
MTVTLEIKPELAATLLHQAAANGMDVSEYASTLIERAAFAKDIQPSGERKTLLELFSPLRDLNLDLERDRDPGREISQ